jgi:hypothetical protein
MDSVTQQHLRADDRHNRAIVSGALRTLPRDICIRIGTDALTTACSTDPSDSAQSQASSDQMLFDQHSHYTEQPDIQDATPPNFAEHHKMSQFRAQRIDTTIWEEQWTNEQARPDHSPRRRVRAPASQSSSEPSRQGMQPAYNNSTKDDATVDAMANYEDTSELRFKQQVERVGHRPLRFAFTHSKSPASDRSRDTIRDIGSSGTNHAIDAAHAGKSQTGLVHHIGEESEPLFNNEADATAAIFDEEPWRVLVDVADESSSHTGTSAGSETSALQPHPTTRSREAECTSWSQHATQGDPNHISSSLISASLPSLRRPAVHGPDAGVKCFGNNSTAPPILNEDEQLWRNIVFGCDEQLSPKAMHERQEGNEQRTGRASSGYLPLSAAASSISRIPFSPMSVQAHRSRGNGVHDAAMSAPRSGSISSPDAAPTGVAEPPSDEKRDAKMAARRCSVTHASLLNNASGDTNLIFWRTSSRTETSRGGLEPTDSDRDSLLEHGTGRVFQPSSAYDDDIPASSDEGLDLVDAHRMF